MKQFTEETRKKMSISAKARCTDDWRKRKSAETETPLDSDEIRKMYNSGMSQTEIADALGTTQKVIWRHMKNHNIPARKAAKRNQSLSDNHMWKGEHATYGAKHMRVYHSLGRAADYGCCICGRKDTLARYDWANLSGNYDDINDYAPMCRSCHKKYDNSRKMKAGGADA